MKGSLSPDFGARDRWYGTLRKKDVCHKIFFEFVEYKILVY